MSNDLVDIDALIEKVESFIKDSNEDGIRLIIGRTQYSEFVSILSWLDLQQAIYMLRVCGVEFLVRAIMYVSYTQRRAIIEQLTEEELVSVLEYVDMYSIFDVVICVDDKDLKLIVEQLKGSKRDFIYSYLSYPKSSVIRLTRRQFVSIAHNEDVASAMKMLQRIPQSLSGCKIYHVFVENATGKYIGAVPVVDLLRYNEGVLIGAVVGDSRAVPIESDIDQTEVLTKFKSGFFLSAPVLYDGRVIGVVVADDLTNLFGLRAEKEIESITGVDVAKEIMDVSVIKSVVSRMPWISLHLVFALGTSFMIDVLKDYVEDRPYDIVTTMVPTVVAINSMCGTHGMMLVMDILSDQDYSFADIGRFVASELIICLAIGAISSLIPMFFFWYLYEFKIGIFCTYSIVLTCLLASSMGVFAPIAIGWITRKKRPSFLSPTIVSFSVETLTYCVMFALIGLFA